MAGTGEASQVNVNGTRARDEAVPESIAIVGMGKPPITKASFSYVRIC